jgi:hypothetical protein
MNENYYIKYDYAACSRSHVSLFGRSKKRCIEGTSEQDQLHTDGSLESNEQMKRYLGHLRARVWKSLMYAVDSLQYVSGQRLFTQRRLNHS